jgi:hypothetical protein
MQAVTQSKLVNVQTSNLPVHIMLGIGVTGMLSMIIWLGFLTQNKDNANEIQKQLGIVAGISGAIVLLFGFAAYIYFSANVNYLTQFILVMTFVNLFLNIFAVSASTLQVTYS